MRSFTSAQNQSSADQQEHCAGSIQRRIDGREYHVGTKFMRSRVRTKLMRCEEGHARPGQVFRRLRGPLSLPLQGRLREHAAIPGWQELLSLPATALLRQRG